MADIRFSDVYLDDFDRPDEDPIEPPWEKNWSAANTVPCKLGSGHIGSTNINPAVSGQSFWSTESFDATEDTIQAWAEATGNAPQAESYRMGLCDDAAGMNGYIVRCENPVGSDHWTIRKYTGGVAVELVSVVQNLPVSGQFVMMEITPSVVNVYLGSTDAETWTLVVSAADTAYRENLFIHLGGNGVGPGWNGMGGGPERPLWLPSFLRRQGG